MAEHHDDDHGNSVAAWAMVGILLVGAAVMSLAVALGSIPMFVVGLVIAILGLVVGKVLALAGYGVDGAISRRDTNVS
ncbi:HGxxPAAW family protein [Knoellia sp. CPCC 206435]|uniref:HGxxPAAW family protein n=1 Tax=Knoellia terrae TaxID=3404797 RepID=UPI003B4330FA